MGCLNCLLALPSPVIASYSSQDVEEICNGIETLYRSGRFPIDKVYSKFCNYDRFNVEQVLPYLPPKWRSKYSDIVLIGVSDRVRHFSFRSSVVPPQQQSRCRATRHGLELLQRVQVSSKTVLAAPQSQLRPRCRNQRHFPKQHGV